MSSASKKKQAVVVEELFCICRRPFDENDEDQMMIECDSCQDWLHGRCVNISIRVASDIETYICPRCITDENPIIYKKRTSNHRHDYSDPGGASKPIQAGTRVFVEQLLKRSFPDAFENNIVTTIKNGADLTPDYFSKHGFNRPIRVENKHELQFSMPDSSQINLTKIEEIVGSNFEIDVIDVELQESFPMSISELNEYFSTEPRTKIYNLISFEISKTNLTMKVTAPKIVCDISWASNNVWPLPVESNDSSEKVKISNYWVKPEVQKYCLISAGNSYTDFHVDFGGSSVWYHIVKGEKVFYLIEPTEENLKIYEKWLCVKNHSEVFLGDKVKKCYIFKITEGNTIFLPTGWIHAVYTPNDSLVFGGNFLHSYGIPLQLRIYDMEVRLKTPEKFRFPAFETFQWYAGKYHEQQLKKSNANRECLSLKMFNDIKYLRDQLKKWINSKNFYELHDYQIPRSIDHDKLMNMMNRELSKAEVLIKSNTSHNNNYSKNSLKIKLKLNPNDLASSTSTLICDKNQSGDENNTKKSSQKNKEILTFAATENIAEIKLDKNMDNGEDVKKDQPPIRLVMKIPKIQSDETKLETKLELLQQQLEPIKPIKLKIKTQDMVTISSNIEENRTESDSNDSNVSDNIIRNEDDELMNELKNSYQDNDFFYPSLKSCGTTARTSKKIADSKHKQEAFVTQSTTQLNQSADAAKNDIEEKKSRKRKLKPYAAEYLKSKEEVSDNHESMNNNDTKSVNDKNTGITEENLIMPPKNRLEKMIEKNLAPKIDETDISKKSSAGSKSEEGSVEDSDHDFAVEDEDDLDYDQEFKIKCEQNLKLSKKLKTKSVKHHKKLENQDKDKDGAVARCTTDPTSKSTSQISKKTKKKGYATTKQRLGKLLKLNRLVNI